MLIRQASAHDQPGIWAILEPVFRAGDTYPLPQDISRDDALAYWHRDDHEVFVAENQDRIVGSYFLCANQPGRGNHVANCGFVTAPDARGQGIARAMLEHALVRARQRAFKAMQFNFVVSTNQRAVTTWKAYGFDVVGRLPSAFRHPEHGFVDALVMFKEL